MLGTLGYLDKGDWCTMSARQAYRPFVIIDTHNKLDISV